MVKICIPRYGKGKFKSLKEAYQQLKKESYGWDSSILKDIIQYNIFYRDLLRTSGLDVLINHLMSEIPELKHEQNIFQDLEKACKNGIFIADYDIQCYDIHDPFTIMGHKFKNLADVQYHNEISAFPSMYLPYIYKPKEITPYSDIHIGQMYENYPKFDSCDGCDDRDYQNYFFSKHTISEDEVHEIYKIEHKSDFCMVHEHIPQELLPILYYRGYGDYMLLATPK